MKIIQRHVLRELLVPLFYCLTGFVAIYVLFELFGSLPRMLDSGLGCGAVVRYLCGYLAPYFHYLAPAALLLATLYALWTMCRHSEIVAMRASGISFLSISLPFLWVSVLMALFVTYVNESFVPREAQRAAQMKAARFDPEKVVHADNIVYRNAARHRTWNVDSLVGDDGTALENVRVTVDRPEGARLMTVTAKRADYLDGEWWFTDARVQHFDANGREIATPVPEADSLPFRLFDAFDERPADFLIQNRPWRFNSVANRLRFLKTHPELSDARRNDLLYDVWAQVMAPWACFVITLLAIPAGIASGRQSVTKGVLCALALYFSYYGVLIGGMVVAKNGWCPAVVAAVLPNVLFLAVGVRAFLKQR